jgi:hypothetical protein
MDYYVIRHRDNRGDIKVLPASAPLPKGFQVLLKTGDYQEAVAARAVLRLAPGIDSLEGNGVYGGP